MATPPNQDTANGILKVFDNQGGIAATVTDPKNNNTADYQQNGFIVPPTPSADGNGLPSQKAQSGLLATETRNLIHWFLPEYGIVKMYVNPSNIQIRDSKLINQVKTKGGFTLQYWGEELTTLTISGTTGSSGIEGINVLHEMYRSEQYAFDSVGLTLASTNANIGAQQQIVGGIGNAIGNAVGGANGTVGASGSQIGAGQFGGLIAQGLFGMDPANQSLSPKNIPSLAQMAFSVEMYYLGWVYRGYFKSMNVTEAANNIGLYEYVIEFIATQRRGYRTNTFAWQKSAISGPSSESIPPTFSRLR